MNPSEDYTNCEKAVNSEDHINWTSEFHIGLGAVAGKDDPCVESKCIASSTVMKTRFNYFTDLRSLYS